MPPKKTSKPKESLIEDFSWFRLPDGMIEKLRLGTEILVNGYYDDSGQDVSISAYVIGYTLYELEPNVFIGWITVVDQGGTLIPSVWASHVVAIKDQLTTEEMLVRPGICKVVALWIKAIKTDSFPASYILHFTLATREEFRKLQKAASKPISASAILKGSEMLKNNNTVKKYATQCLDKITKKLVKIPKKNKKAWTEWIKLKEALKISLNLADAF